MNQEPGTLNFEHISNCPICNSPKQKQFMACKDNTVSGKIFDIVECEICGFKFTNPRPKEEDLGAYYKSEDYVSHSNTSKGIVNSLYQSVRKYTLIKKLQLISSLSKKGSVLDVGCGTGEFLSVCKKAGWKTMGIEPSEEARKLAIENHKLEVFEEAKIGELEKQSFDIITLWHVLEHVPKLNQRVEELKALLKPGGSLIIAVPNPDSLDAKTYKEHWAAYDVPRHLYHFRPQDITNLMDKHGMRVTRTLPMLFDSFYVAMLSEKYRSGKTNLIKAVFNGFISNLSAIKTAKKYSSQIYIISV